PAAALRPCPRAGGPGGRPPPPGRPTASAAPAAARDPDSVSGRLRSCGCTGGKIQDPRPVLAEPFYPRLGEPGLDGQVGPAYRGRQGQSEVEEMHGPGADTGVPAP